MRRGLCCYLGKDQSLRLLVNGQTGEVVGNVPRSSWKIAAVVVSVIVVFGGMALAFSVCGGLTMAVSQ